MATIAKIVCVNGDGTESRSVSENGEFLRFTFADGQTLRADVQGFDAALLHILALHGLKQKLSDSYASADGDATVAYGLAAVMYERLKVEGAAGWTTRGEGTARESDLAKALAEVTGQDMPTVIAKLEEKSKEERKALRKHPQLAAVLARIAAERAAAKAAKAEAKADEAEPLVL